MLSGFLDKKVMYKEGQIGIGGETVYVDKALLDTGASSGSYVGQSLVDRIPNAVLEPCYHKVKLGDGTTEVIITQSVVLDVSLYEEDLSIGESFATEFFVLPTLGEEIIIGLPDILGNFYDYFTGVLERAREAMRNVRIKRLHQLYGLVRDQLCTPAPRRGLLKAYATEAKNIKSWYSKHKQRVICGVHREIIQSDTGGKSFAILHSDQHGTAFADSRIEHLAEIIQDLRDFPMDEILDAWSLSPELCPEEEETPDPLAMGSMLHYMEMTNEEARAEYLGLLDTQISPEMRAAIPRIMDIMTSPAALETFSPSAWNGLKVPPIDFETAPGMPASMRVRSRPIRQELYVHAKKEFDRLVQYFYDPKSSSAIASPLVIAPKATSPYIRFCGDYREINQYITIPKYPIPIVQHELTKASQYKVYVDLDMTNSFHQIPLSEKSSNLLSVQTPWGLVRPKFLPEGVGPASGILQSIVKEVFDFEDFPDWTIVIFDNFLILANDFEDAATKLERVIARCAQFGVVLKIKKSFIGYDKVTFFGYEVSEGQWKLSDSRKAAIEALPFPKSKKEMQSFLGAALFFHNHIPDYSEWSAKLYEMTHDGFSWDPKTWKFDYGSYFERFKQCIQKSATLYFPRYDLPWIIRCDASEHAVGAILFQVLTNPNGSIEHQPIALSSKRFSGPAQKWDAYKREAYAIYHSVHAFSWYLRGKEFLVETDHRNLQWIETSQSPIVCRWRALLQAFNFKIRHIPGRDNKVADWISRPALNVLHSCMVLCRECTPMEVQRLARVNQQHGRQSTGPAALPSAAKERSLESMLQEVHGGRSLHYGAAFTWMKAKSRFPTAKISIEAVRTFVRECPLCQKTRRTGILGLAPKTLSLKPDSYRRTVGIDHVAITPEDKYGNKCAILVVEHFSHYGVAYPAKDYTAESVAKALFKHYCSHGTYDQIASDPGSAFMSEVVQQLNSWLSMEHKVSLTGRHESNGCEGTIKQLLRHLRTLVLDERLYDKWSDDTVLPLINLHLVSYPTEETGKYTPLQLKFGTLDAKRFCLPEMLSLAPGAKAASVIKELDENLRHIRTVSRALQATLAEERAARDLTVSSYQPGDLVLFNPREQPTDHLPSKLSTDWLGPYRVVQQVKNDVSVKHIVLHTDGKFHVSRLKPFIGSEEQALEIALHDQHQFTIQSINFFTGNPFVRMSTAFNITFGDGTTSTLPYGGDFIHSQQFDQYVNSLPILFPLRFPAKIASSKVAELGKLAITTVQPGMEVFVDLRIYDGARSTWFDSLSLPDNTRPYVTRVILSKWYHQNHRMIVGTVPFFPPDHPKHTLWFSAYDIMAFVHMDWPYWTTVLLDESNRIKYPHVLQ